jgi:glycosyltransferase involved in cell wall biosynthesis
MLIEAYIIGWNREDTIALTINHYKQFCSHITIFDNFSDDKTRDIAYDLGCDVQLFGKKGSLDDGEYVEIKNNCWKKSDADYIIVCDDDEILYHPQIESVFEAAKEAGVTIFKTQGFSIHSEEMPKKSWTEFQNGVLDDNYSKSVIFSPALKEIGYIYGCHESRPQGRLVYSQEKLWLLHYRSMGGVERLIQRHKQYVERFSPINLKWKLGIHYTESEDLKRKQWKESLEKSVPLSSVGFV